MDKIINCICSDTPAVCAQGSPLLSTSNSLSLRQCVNMSEQKSVLNVVMVRSCIKLHRDNAYIALLNLVALIGRDDLW